MSLPALFILTGSSRGLGAAMALQLLADGHTVLGVSRSPSPQLAAAVRDAPHRLMQWTADLAESTPLATRLQAWLGAQGPGRYAQATLINNAGVIAPLRPLAGLDPADTQRALRVGLEAAMVLTGAFLSTTQSWPGPRKVLNISSGLGRRAMAGCASYCAAKAGLDHFSRCVALEEAAKPSGARIVSLAPGVIATGMQVQLRAADPVEFPDRQGFVQLEAQGQLLSPEDAARRVLAFLKRPDFGDQPVADVRDT